jgi:hypothetical protein
VHKTLVLTVVVGVLVVSDREQSTESVVASISHDFVAQLANQVSKYPSMGCIDVDAVTAVDVAHWAFAKHQPLSSRCIVAHSPCSWSR